MENGRARKVVVISAVFFAMIIAISVIGLMQPRNSQSSLNNAKHVLIDNFKKATGGGVPGFYEVEVESSIYQILTKYNNIDKDIKVSASVREGSFSETDRDRTKSVDFLVDIPDLKHTFRITFEYLPSESVPTEYEVNVLCPKYQDVIYPETACYLAFDPIYSLDSELPTKIDDNTTVSIKHYASSHKTRAGKPYLEAKTSGCRDGEIIKSELAEWLKKRFWDIKLFYVEYVNDCGGL